MAATQRLERMNKTLALSYLPQSERDKYRESDPQMWEQSNNLAQFRERLPGLSWGKQSPHPLPEQTPELNLPQT